MQSPRSDKKTDLIKGEDETVTADYWKYKYEESMRFNQSLQSENEQLNTQQHSTSSPYDEYTRN